MLNIYKTKGMKKYLDADTVNPYYTRHNLEVNKLFMCIGPTGAGKSNFLVNLITQFESTFEEIIIYTADIHEPLYTMLSDQSDAINIKTLKEIEPVDSLDKVKQKLIIFDDFLSVPKKSMSLLSDYATRGRKKLCTMVYLTQNYYSVPTDIRNQIRYLVVLKLSNKRNLDMIIRGMPIDLSSDDIKAIIADATKIKFDVCIIDLTETDPNKTIRKNFNEYYTLL